MAGVASVGACGTSQDQATIKIVTVDDPFVGPPAATTLNVDGISQDGGTTAILHGASLATGTVDLGSLTETDVYALEITAFDGDGGRVAYGESLPFEMGAIAQDVFPIFVERSGELARLPTPMADGRNAPLVGVLGGEYIFEAGGTDSTYATTTELYDLIWLTASAGTSFTSAPQSLALSSMQALGIAPDGASWIDTTTSEVTSASLPAGGTWADVAGGASVLADDGTIYVVGGTRQSGGSTSAVLVVSTSQTLSFAFLATARLGAAAAWVSGRGLVVAGGSASGAGVEILNTGDTNASPLGFPPDSAVGGGVDALDGSHVLLVEGAAARELDLACSASSGPDGGGGCAAAPWPVPLSVPLSFAQVFDIDATEVLVVGEDSAGTSHAQRVSASAVTELPFKIPRKHARALRLPMGQVAIVGGNATMESFVP